MNKIKLLYDVFKTMKEQDEFKGTLKVEAVKDNVQVLKLDKDFNVNTLNGDAKIKFEIETDCEGKKVKHESNTQFNINDCPIHKLHCSKIQEQHKHFKCNGIKSHIAKLTFLFHVLNNMNAEEKDGKKLISLDLNVLIKELKDQCKDVTCEDIKKHIENHEPHNCIKEIINDEYSNATLMVWIKEDNKVEKLELLANGTKQNIKGLLDLV